MDECVHDARKSGVLNCKCNLTLNAHGKNMKYRFKLKWLQGQFRRNAGLVKNYPPYDSFIRFKRSVIYVK